ncbi:MAG: nickel-binding protein [Nitrososphaerales archaeon]
MNETMPKVIVFHFTNEGKLPKLSKKELEDIRRKFLEVLKEYPDVTLHGTYVDEEGMGICDWEAPNAEVVKEIVRKALGAPPTDPTIVVEKVL